MIEFWYGQLLLAAIIDLNLQCHFSHHLQNRQLITQSHHLYNIG